MNGHDRPDEDSLRIPDRAHIDQVCDRFETACKADQGPRIEEFLTGAEGLAYEVLLRHLLSVELSYRKRRGDSLEPKDYHERFPQHDHVVQGAFERVDVGHGNLPSQPDHGDGALLGLHIRCPHCHNPVEIAMDTQLEDITCGSCGSHFSLVDESTQTRQASEITTVGHFKLIERLGIGGFGTVWKARDTSLDRTVALKIPRKGQLGGDELEKFLREARTAAQLRHPNVVTVHEVGRDGDTVYIVSEIVRGASLAEWMNSERLSIREAAQLCAKIADALEHAHQQGVIHRDLKPQNIIVDTDLEPHLTDFGLAKRISGEITLTIDGQVLGTPAYMPPEQASGEGHTADRRSDVYSLGVILFQLLTAELPFRGNANMLIHQVLHDEPPSPRRLNGSIPRDLETICLKCMEKEPSKRFQRAADVAEDLRRFARGDPIRARPTRWPTRAWRWCRRKPAVAGLLGAVACALLLGTVVSSYFAVRLASSQAEKNSALVRALFGASTALRQSRPEGYRREVWSIIGQIRQLGESPADRDRLRDEAVGAMGDFVGFSAVEHGAFPADVTAIGLHPTAECLAVGTRNGLIRLTQPHSGEVIDTLQGHENSVLAITFAAGGDRMVSVAAATDQACTVLFWEQNMTSEWSVVSRMPLSEAVDSAQFVGDGKYLLARTAHTVYVWDLQQRTLAASCTDQELSEVSRPPDPDGTIRAVAMSPDEQLLAVGYAYSHDNIDEQGLVIWNVPQRQVLKRIALNLGSPYSRSMAFSADGTSFAYGCDQALILYEVPSFRQRSARRIETIKAVGFDRDNQFLATVDLRGRVTVWNASLGNEIAALTHRRRRAPAREALTFSGDRSFLAVSNLDAVRIWSLKSPERTLLDGHPQAIPTVDFHPTRDLLATGSGDRTVAFWDVTTGDKLFTLPFEGAVQSVRFSPDGKVLAVVHGGGENRDVQLWDLSSRTLIARATHQLGTVYAVAFVGDGRRLAASAERGIALWDLPSFAPKDGPPAEVQPAMTRPGTYCLHIAASPDGRYLVWPEHQTGIRMWDLEASQSVRQAAARMLQGWHGLAFYPDSKRFVYVNFEGIANTWDVAADRRDFALGDTDAFRSPHIALSNDGRWLAGLADPEEVTVWDTTTGSRRLAFRPERASVWALAWNRGATKLAAGLSDGGLVIWDLSRVDRRLAELGLGEHVAAPAVTDAR